VGGHGRESAPVPHPVLTSTAISSWGSPPEVVGGVRKEAARSLLESGRNASGEPEGQRVGDGAPGRERNRSEEGRTGKSRPVDTGEHPIYTAVLRAGEDRERDLGGLSPALHRSSAYAFESAAHGARVHEGEEPGYFYGRIGSPTQASLEAALAELEGGEAALALASGMAAISTLLFTVLEPGDHVVASRALYATTASLLDRRLGSLGVEVIRVEGTDAAAFEEALRPSTRLLWVESPANPTLDLVDLEAVARLGRARGILTVADNTFATPFNQTPLELGIDVVVHSATKYLGGHGDAVAGGIVGPGELIERARWGTLKHLGGVISPDAAWLVLRGLRTLAVRMERHNGNAGRIAAFLEQHPAARVVHYPGLTSHPGHDLARNQMRGFGGMVAFELPGLETARRFVDALELCTLAVSLGDVGTLIQHSASMTHASVPAERRRATGITDGLLRMSVGLERADDLIGDLERAFEAAGLG